MAIVFLALGSNLGDRQVNLHRALIILKRNKIIPLKVSSFIETIPVGGPKQNQFINTTVKATTALLPQQLLITIKQIERQIGRLPSILNGPRVIDIDILLYDSLSISTPQLTIPHPRMSKRSFVLDPLKEIAPELFVNGQLKLPVKNSILENQKI